LLVDYNTEKDRLNNILKYPFLLTSSPTSSYTKGVSLVLFTSFFLIILLICFFRTIFSDPGEFPDPTDLEFNIVLKNILYDQRNKNNCLIDMKNFHNEKKELNLILDREITQPLTKPKFSKNKNFDYSNKKEILETGNNKNNYNKEDSNESSNNDSFNILNFGKNIGESPICFEEYNKSTELLENWRYVPMVKSNDIIQKNLEYFKNYEYKEKTDFDDINKNKFGTSRTDYNCKSNNNSFSKTLNIKQNISHRKPIKEKEIETFDEKILNHKNSDCNMQDQFEGFVGYDVGRAFLCGTCVRIKVERSHHCKQCGKCILKMDHHCPWLSNCIGYSNYKFFLLIHLYGMILCSFVFFSYWETLYNNCFDYSSSVITLSWNMFVYTINLGLFIFLVWLFYINWTLMFQGLTVIENADRERFPSAKFNNPYDFGYYKNFVTVFGTSPLIWFLPIKHEDIYEGIYFKKNNEKEDKLFNYN